MAALRIIVLFHDYVFYVLIIGILLYVLRTRYQRGLNRVPGPFLNSISPIPRIWSAWKGHSHDKDLELHKKYGPVVRLTPTMLSISDPKEIDTIYGISSKFYKSRFYDPVRFYDDEGLVPDPFVLADKEMHRRMKRNASSAYSLSSLVQLESLVEGPIMKLVNHLETKYLDTEPCDIGQLVHYFSLDTILNITFGREIGFIEKGDTLGMCAAMELRLLYLATIGQVPWMHKLLLGNQYMSRLSSFWENNSFIDEVMNISVAETEKGLRDLKDGVDSPNTFLKQLLATQQNNPKSLTDREVSTHTFGNITAGSDTTSTAIRSIIIHTLTHPEVYQKLCNEIRSAGLTSPVSWSSASRLPYLKAVIQEAMRIHPSVAMPLSRSVPAGGAVIGGYSVPAGIDVGINPYVVHRHPVVFPNPDNFDPDRWLTTDQAHLALMNRTFFAFGAGPHTCSGRHISILEITKLIPSLLLKFDLELVGKVDDIQILNYFMHLQKGVTVRIKQRAQQG